MLRHIEAVDDNDSLELSMAAVGAAMSDPSRIKMLCALMDGRAWTATELSIVADVASSTASAHLARLFSEKLVTCLSQGRHRYYRLAGQDIAELIEMMMGVSWKRVPAPQTRAPQQLRTSRTCYDHLAGEVAVRIYDAMVSRGWLEADGNTMTPKGRQRFQASGVVLDSKTRRKACCACLDWSERRFHLGGDAGAAFFTHCENKGWLTRIPGHREVTITSRGQLALKQLFDIEV